MQVCGMGLGVRGLPLRQGGGGEQMEEEATTLCDLGEKNFLAFPFSSHSPEPAVRSLVSSL